MPYADRISVEKPQRADVEVILLGLVTWMGGDGEGEGKGDGERGEGRGGEARWLDRLKSVGVGCRIGALLEHYGERCDIWFGYPENRTSFPTITFPVDPAAFDVQGKGVGRRRGNKIRLLQVMQVQGGVLRRSRSATQATDAAWPCGSFFVPW